MTSLPYFDAILAACRENEVDIVDAFGANVHWGFWENPQAATGAVDDFVLASDAMTRKVCDAAGVTDGMTVLDVGCGFGGTVDSMNCRFHRMKLTGLNIDARQLERARSTVKQRADNAIAFVEGDACSLPFPDASFDRVLAVECIFHFPSRLRFMREARRVLRPGGMLMVSEYVAPLSTLHRMLLRGALERRAVVGFYGDGVPIPSAFYRLFARLSGFNSPEVIDISQNVLPTWPLVGSLIDKFPIGPRDREQARRATESLTNMSEREWLRYEILTFRTRP